MTEKYCFGDITVEATYRYDYIKAYCRDYVTDKEPDIFITVTDEDLRREEAFSRKNGDTAHYPDGYLEFLALYRKFCDTVADKGVILMHGCAVATDGGAYIFTAPSGTGKTTHARLWLELLGDKAFVLNGDKPLINANGEDPVVYGTPWDGKEHLSRNEKLPFKAVCLIERSEQNSISELSSDDALKILLSQVYRPEDTSKMQSVLNTMISLVGKVRFYRLRCNISREAADLSYNTLTKEQPL